MYQDGFFRSRHGRLAAATLLGIGAMAGAVSGQTITEFPIPTALASPEGIAAGPDGSLWFVELRRRQDRAHHDIGFDHRVPIAQPG